MARSCFSVITPILLEYEKQRCLKKSRKSNCARYICRAIISCGDYNSWTWGNVKNWKELNAHFTFQYFGLRCKGFLPLLDKIQACKYSLLSSLLAALLGRFVSFQACFAEKPGGEEWWEEPFSQELRGIGDLFKNSTKVKGKKRPGQQLPLELARDEVQNKNETNNDKNIIAISDK